MTDYDEYLNEMRGSRDGGVVQRVYSDGGGGVEVLNEHVVARLFLVELVVYHVYEALPGVY